MKAITVRQPWASLIAAGVKTVETRPRRTSYRGRIAIHAAAHQEHSGKFLLLARQARMSGAIDADAERRFRALDVPFGAVVASAVLTDCVPIVGEDEDLDRDSLDRACIEHRPPGAMNAGLWLWPVEDEGEDMAEPADVSRQLPYGDYTPGRWALLLDDIAPTTERCPACWGDGLRRAFTDSDQPSRIGGHTHPCPACGGATRCEPIPARGQLPVPWEWTP